MPNKGEENEYQGLLIEGSRAFRGKLHPAYKKGMEGGRGELVGFYFTGILIRWSILLGRLRACFPFFKPYSSALNSHFSVSFTDDDMSRHVGKELDFEGKVRRRAQRIAHNRSKLFYVSSDEKDMAKIDNEGEEVTVAPARDGSFSQRSRILSSAMIEGAISPGMIYRI